MPPNVPVQLCAVCGLREFFWGWRKSIGREKERTHATLNPTLNPTLTNNSLVQTKTPWGSTPQPGSRAVQSAHSRFSGLRITARSRSCEARSALFAAAVSSGVRLERPLGAISHTDWKTAEEGAALVGAVETVDDVLLRVPMREEAMVGWISGGLILMPWTAARK